MTMKSFTAAVIAATFFIGSVAQASVEDFEYLPEVDDPFYDETLEYPGEYGEIWEYEEPEPEPETPAVEDADEGLEFLVYHKDGVMAFAIIAAHEKYQLRPILARHQIRGRATVSQMTQELADIAIVNASYFAGSGILIGVTKVDGEIVSTDGFNRSAIGIYDDGTAIFGRVSYRGEIEYNGAVIPISGVNCERSANSLVLYNSYFASTTGTNDSGLEVVIKDGVIDSIFYGKGNNAIPAGGYVLSAHGTAAEFLKFARVGEEITINQKIESGDGDFNAIPNVVGAGPRLVMDGWVYVTAAEEKFPADIRVGRAPRSAVGVTSYGDYILAVVDGRQAHSRGCTLQEWAEILVNEFGAFNAINLDGGGSSALVVKDKLVNKPSDGQERPVGNALAILPK